jgi:integrase/recombinase XerD
MREKGMKATGCNAAIRAINAYLHWNSPTKDRKCAPGCAHFRIPRMKEPELILPTFTEPQIRLLSCGGREFHPELQKAVSLA